MEILIFVVCIGVLGLLIQFRKEFKWYRRMLGGNWYLHADPFDGGAYWSRNSFGNPSEEKWIKKDGKKISVFKRRDLSMMSNKDMDESIAYGFELMKEFDKQTEELIRWKKLSEKEIERRSKIIDEKRERVFRIRNNRNC